MTIARWLQPVGTATFCAANYQIIIKWQILSWQAKGTWYRACLLYLKPNDPTFNNLHEKGAHNEQTIPDRLRPGHCHISARGICVGSHRSIANPKKNVQTQDSDQIYGSRLMTLPEGTEFRAQMQAAKSVAEREQLRNEHHKAMQERAASRGITLPDQPPAGGQGMGPGSGMMGQGGGMNGSRQRAQPVIRVRFPHCLSISCCRLAPERPATSWKETF